MNEIIFYAIMLGLLCIAGAVEIYYTEIRPMHRNNKSFGELLRERKAELETKKLEEARAYVADGRKTGLIKF